MPDQRPPAAVKKPVAIPPAAGKKTIPPAAGKKTIPPAAGKKPIPPAAGKKPFVIPPAAVKKPFVIPFETPVTPVTPVPSSSVPEKDVQGQQNRKGDTKKHIAKPKAEAAHAKQSKGLKSSGPWWKGKIDDIDFSLGPSARDEKTCWFDVFKPLADDNGKWKCSDQSQLDEIRNAVKSALASKQGNSKSSSDDKWINDLIKSGTHSDKVAALALKVQESPLHNIETLDLLVSIANKKEQRVAQLALEALKDLLINNLLPDRRLINFKDQPLVHADMNLRLAAFFMYEDILKNTVEKAIAALGNGMRSNVDFFKRSCLELATDMLVSKPEQEGKLLEIIVNKLGDPSSAVCVKAIEQLKKVINTHAAMKFIVAREVRQVIYSPNVKLKTIYNGIVFLSQINLVKGDHKVAAQLVECYLSLFEKALSEKELGSRLLSSLLTGVNKATPFLNSTEPLRKYVDSLFKIVHTGSFTSSTQALMLLSHIAVSESSAEAEKESDIATRFYRALYAKLQSVDVGIRTKNALFLNLLYRSIKNDKSDERTMAFLKRLCMCATQSSPPVAAGLIFLVSEIMASRRVLHTLLSKSADVGSTSAYKKADEFLEAQNFGNFDASKRDPEYATQGGAPSLWEMALLRHHFHPSVRAFSSALLEAPSHKIEYSGDPTVDFSLMAFLNRFAYKNPKKATSEKTRASRPSGTEKPMNDLAFMEKESSNVAPDKTFFHKFFGERSRLQQEGKARIRKKKNTKDGDEDSDPGMEETQMDIFADKLAEDMMRDHARSQGMDDPDMDDFSDDGSDGEDDDSSSNSSSGSVQKKPNNYLNNEQGNEDGSEDGKKSDGDANSDDDDADDGAEDDEEEDDDDDDDDSVMEFGGDSDSDMEMEDTKARSKSGMRKARKKNKGGGDFADATDYEEEMDAIVSELAAYHGKGSSVGSDIEKHKSEHEQEPKESKKRNSLSKDGSSGNRKKAKQSKK